MVASGSLSAGEDIQIHLNTPNNQELSHRYYLYYICPQFLLKNALLSPLYQLKSQKIKELNIGLIGHS